MDKLYKIPGIDNYLINKKGEVYNTTRKKFLKPIKNGRGYVSFVLYIKNKRKAIFRHRLLASTFLPNPDNKTEIDHINGLAGDDRLENLRWVTHKENVNYWHKDQRTYLRRPIILRELYNKKDIVFNSHIEACKYLKVHRYEVLRRLSCKFGFVFKDGTQIKWKDDDRKFPVIKDIKEAIEYYSNENKIKLYNHFTKEEKIFDKMKDACSFLSISPSTLTMKINSRAVRIFPSGWEAKYFNDNTPWSAPTEYDLKRIKSGGIDHRPIVVTNVKTGQVYHFSKCRDALTMFPGTPTKIHYRLTVNKTKPCPDGYIYNYLDEIQNY